MTVIVMPSQTYVSEKYSCPSRARMSPNSPQTLQRRMERKNRTMRGLDELSLQLQSLGRVAKREYRDREPVEEAPEGEISDSASHHNGECIFFESHCTRWDNVDLDISLPPTEGTGEQRAICPRSDVVSGPASTGTAPHHTENLHQDGISNFNPAADPVSRQVVGSPSGDVSVPTAAGTGPTSQREGGEAYNENGTQVAPEQVVGPRLDDVSGGASTGTEPTLQQEGGEASNENGTQVTPEQVVGPRLDDVSGGASTGTEPMLQQEGGEDSSANGRRVAPPSSSSSPLDISGRYTRSNQKLLFFLSTIVAFIALLLQHELVQEMSHRSTGIIRPGWARYRNDGLEGSSFRQ